MKIKLNKIRKVGKKQIDFAGKIGLNVAGETFSVAYAIILDLIDKEFLGKELGCQSEKQIELASKFGYDISKLSRRVGDSIINDIMVQLNLEAIESNGFTSGCSVMFRFDLNDIKYTISSITEDGLIYFKGRQGNRGWARNLIKVD